MGDDKAKLDRPGPGPGRPALDPRGRQDAYMGLRLRSEDVAAIRAHFPGWPLAQAVRAILADWLAGTG